MLYSNPLLSQMPVAKKLFHSSSRVLLTIDCPLVPFIFNKKKARKKRGVYHQRHVLANLSHLHQLLILCYKKSIWRQKSALCAGSFSTSCCTEKENYLGPEGHLLSSPGACSSWFPASVISAQKKAVNNEFGRLGAGTGDLSTARSRASVPVVSEGWKKSCVASWLWHIWQQAFHMAAAASKTAFWLFLC